MIVLSPTDGDWFRFLRKRQFSGLVNFWTPTDWHIKGLTKGDYWYFLLKGAEPRKIGGGGRFLEYVTMHASEAWKRFGEGNGTKSLDEMIGRLNGFIKHRANLTLPSADPIIGCVILDNCIFLEDKDQRTAIELGLKFPRQVVKFKKFDDPTLPLLSTAVKVDLEGVERATGTELGVEQSDYYNPSSEADAREKTLASIVRRRGQPGFRQALIVAYEGKCAITGCDVKDALEAAHITPYMGNHTNTIENGLLLRADIHTLFDLGLVAISPIDLKVILHRDLRDGHYGYLHGKMMNPPKSRSDWPSTTALEKHKKDSGL